MDTIDSTQASTIETPDLGTLWTNLTDINSCISIAGEQQMALYNVDRELLINASFVNFRRDQSRKLQAIIERLEGPRDSLRLTINERVRPNLRPLNILSLPDELLRQIFEYLKGDTSMYRYVFCALGDGDVEQVKKLRLTCRRFCENSSHLLMSGLKVDMTPLSISHLIEISQHPTISKGIRSVRINLGRHYDSSKAQDILAFARFHALRMRTHVENWGFFLSIPMEFDKTPAEVYERGIERAISIAESWEEAARRGVIKNCPEHDVLRKAHQHYRQCYESQRLSGCGVFAQTISSAMQRMPTATWLNFSSEDDFRTREARESRSLYCVRPEDLDDPNLLELVPKLQIPETSWDMASYRGLRSPPIRILPSILLSIEQAGITLTGLDILVDQPSDMSSLSATEVEYPKLRAVSQKLKAFQFRPRNGSNLVMPNILSGFLSAILDTSALQEIDLHFNFPRRNGHGDGDDGPTPTISMAPLVLARTWPNLKRLQYNGPFYFEELQRVLNRIGEHVDFYWSGYLMDASWAGVLDFLRGRVSWKFSLGDMGGSIAGAECDDMTREEVNFLFGEDKAVYDSGSKATHFIQEFSTSNPVRDWVNGDLVMPAPAAEEDVNFEPETDNNSAT